MFEIMVHEGIHQGHQDHLWLHYYEHFADRILKNMDKQTNEHIGEWDTPFHYLLCHLFKVATDWAEQSAYIDEKDISQENTKTKCTSTSTTFQKNLQNYLVTCCKKPCPIIN